VKAFINFLYEEFDGDLKRVGREKLGGLREKLLRVNGIGPETADSILLYGLEKPIFVVDTYTRRILSRHQIILGKPPTRKFRTSLWIIFLLMKNYLMNTMPSWFISGKQCVKRYRDAISALF